MSDPGPSPITTLCPPILSNTTWELIGVGASVPDMPASANCIVQSVQILLSHSGDTAHPDAGQPYLDVYSKQANGTFVMRGSSALVGLDISNTSTRQTLPCAGLIVLAGDYVGLRVDGGFMHVQWVDGQTHHMWWDVNRDTGAAGRYVGMVSCGWQVNVAGLGNQPQERSVPTTPDAVARRLAPTIHLHPQDPHRPSSVEWFLNRCELRAGSATSFLWTSGHFPGPQPALTPDVTPVLIPAVRVAGPLTGETLAGGSSSSAFGGGELDSISLFPLSAPPGHSPTYTWQGESLLQGYYTYIGGGTPATNAQGGIAVPSQDYTFSDYQNETFLGNFCPQNATIATESYCRITTSGDSFLISYFQFYPYNGGSGPLASYTSRPLSSGSGNLAHIGDWTRITAKVKINQWLVTLESVDFEAHGDSNIVSSGANSFTNKTLDTIDPIVAYAAWHSHELYPSAGSYHYTLDVAADGGPTWNTQQNLVFIGGSSPPWVSYNGLWGANVAVTGLINYFKNGPQGPAFHGYWTNNGQQQWCPFSIPPGVVGGGNVM